MRYHTVLARDNNQSAWFIECGFECIEEAKAERSYAADSYGARNVKIITTANTNDAIQSAIEALNKQPLNPERHPMKCISRKDITLYRHDTLTLIPRLEFSDGFMFYFDSVRRVWSDSVIDRTMVESDGAGGYRQQVLFDESSEDITFAGSAGHIDLTEFDNDEPLAFQIFHGDKLVAAYDPIGLSVNPDY